MPFSTPASGWPDRPAAPAAETRLIMTDIDTAPPPGAGDLVGKGLRSGALGLFSSTVMGVASTAPAYSLAATLGVVVVAVGVHSPVVVLLAFVPMLFVAIGYQELNKVEPDCGTTFTWATKAFGPKTGWLGGWGIVAADILVMASLAQVAGQYFFLLLGVDSIGTNATSPWVLLVGIAWIIVMTWICYVGIEVSAISQKVLLTVELVMLLVFSVVALARVYSGHGASVSVHPAWSWLNPFAMSWSSFTAGILLMLFIYWGWDTAVSVNEETQDPSRTPGRAAVLSTVLLLVTYLLVTTAALAFAGTGSKGIGLANPANAGDVISVLGNDVFGGSGFGTFLTRLLVLMVLSSAAASTQTTILPTARTTLAMAAYRSVPKAFGRIHRRHLTPSVSTLTMGAVSIVLYVGLNFVSGGNVIYDSVSALGWMIAFYYGLTGFACAWTFRHQWRDGTRSLWMKGILPFAGGLMLFAALAKSVHDDWSPDSSYTSWTVWFTHTQVGGVFVIGALTAVLGVLLLLLSLPFFGPFFHGQVLAPDPDLAAHLRDDTPTDHSGRHAASAEEIPRQHRTPRR
jgi:amino acid transporter